MAKFARWLLSAALFLLVAGYTTYVIVVAAMQPDEDARADAIVVLTGGRERVVVALRLLEEGRGERLLVSGVGGATEADLRAMAPQGATHFECCVDVDRIAANTAGNARETAAWAQSRGYRRVLLVTDAFHMPRAQLELSHAAPDVQFVPWPATRWGEQGLRGSLLEYAKLLVIGGRETVRRLFRA